MSYEEEIREETTSHSSGFVDTVSLIDIGRLADKEIRELKERIVKFENSIKYYFQLKKNVEDNITRWEKSIYSQVVENINNEL